MLLEPKEVRPNLLVVGENPDWLIVHEVEGGVEIVARHAARNAKAATVTIREEDLPKVVILRWSYNARDWADISGDAVLWSFSDRHGMELVAVLRRGGGFEVAIPPHHGHGHKKRYRGVVYEDGTVELTPLPSTNFLVID